MRKDSSKFEPFPFMVDRHHDMLIGLRLTSDQPANLRRISVHYKLTNLIANYEYDVTDPKYKGNYVEFSKDMYQLLIGEIKSRVIARQEFTVWFYSEEDMKYIVDEVCAITKDKVPWVKFGQKLVENAALVPTSK